MSWSHSIVVRELREVGIIALCSYLPCFLAFLLSDVVLLCRDPSWFLYGSCFLVSEVIALSQSSGCNLPSG